MLLRIGGKALHFKREQVVVVIRLEFDFFFARIIFNFKSLLLQVRFEGLFASLVLSQIQRLDKLGLERPERPHARKVIRIDGIAPLIDGFFQARRRPHHHGHIERRQNDFGLERTNLVRLAFCTKPGFSHLRIGRKPLFHKT